MPPNSVHCTYVNAFKGWINLKTSPSWAVLEFRFQRRWTVNASSHIVLLFFLILPGTNSATKSTEQNWEHISGFPRNSPRFVDFKSLRNPPHFLVSILMLFCYPHPYFLYSCHISCSSHYPCCYHPDSIWWEVPIMKLLIMCSFLQPFNSSVLGYTRYWNTLSLISSLNMTDKISQPCQTTSKIVDPTFFCSSFR